MRAIRKKRIVVNRNGGNSVTPIFAEINAKLKAKFIINTKMISLVLKIVPFIV